MTWTVLLVGCGAIGTAVVDGCRDLDGVKEILLHDQDPARVEALADRPRTRPAADLDVELDHVDVVVEAASQDAVREVGPRALEAGCDLVVVSVGALADDDLREELEALAREHGCTVHGPSGAVAGLDGVRAAREAGLDACVLETRKPLDALPAEDVADLPPDEASVLYEGPAREAVRRFPKNVNVAAALSLNGLGLDETRVRIVADPGVDRNRHRVLAEGAFGELEAQVRNVPSPDNPATSYLAPLSVVALLRRLTSPLRIG